jgi:hypothetical protein
MSQEKPVETESTPEEKPAYEPPRLVRVGSLRELVGKTGGRTDNGGPSHKKP